jgi:hypothetical protein
MGRRMSSGLARIPASVLEMELRRRARGVKALQKRRLKLLAKLDQLDSLIRDSGGAIGNGRGGGRRGGGGGRPRNEMSLEESLAKLLSGKTMSVTDAAEGVQKSGYRTGAANFRTIVNQCLIRSDRFKKVSRGQYTAK